MVKYAFLKQRKDINTALLNLDILKKYMFSAMNLGQITPTSQYGIEAAINNLIADLRCISMKYSTKLFLTISNLNGIVEVAQTLKLDLKKIPVNDKISKYLDVIIVALTRVMRREKQEFSQQDVDVMIKEFNLMGKQFN